MCRALVRAIQDVTEETVCKRDCGCCVVVDGWCVVVESQTKGKECVNGEVLGGVKPSLIQSRRQGQGPAVSSSRFLN